MRKTFNLKSVCLVLACLLGAPASKATALCENGNFQRVGKGWLSTSAYSTKTVYFKTTKALLEPPAISHNSALGAVARAAALSSLLTYYKQLSPPASGQAQLQVVGLQAAELTCAGTLFLLYQVEVAKLSWQAPTQDSETETNAITDVQNILRQRETVTIEN